MAPSQPKAIKFHQHIKGHEHILRVNYLFQASEEMLKLDPPQPHLAQNYGQVLTTISEKTSAKLDFTMKRFICKKCRTVLVPGVNLTYRLKRRKKKSNKNKKLHNFPTQIISCKSCGERKTFLTTPNHQLKTETFKTLMV